MARLQGADRSRTAPGFYDDHEWGVPVGTPFERPAYMGKMVLAPPAAGRAGERIIDEPAVIALQQQIEAGRLPSAVFLG